MILKITFVNVEQNCVGYILSDDDWPKLKKELKKQKILKAVRINI